MFRRVFVSHNFVDGLQPAGGGLIAGGIFFILFGLVIFFFPELLIVIIAAGSIFIGLTALLIGLKVRSLTKRSDNVRDIEV